MFFDAGVIHLSSDCDVADGSAKTGQKDSLEIRTPERTYYVYAPASANSKNDIAEWQAAIQRVTKKNKAATKEKKAKVRACDPPPPSPSPSPLSPPSFSLLVLTHLHSPTKKKAKAVELCVRGIMCECCEQSVRATITKHKVTTLFVKPHTHHTHSIHRE